MANKNSNQIVKLKTEERYNKSNHKLAFIIVLIFIIICFIILKTKNKTIVYRDIQIILNNDNISSKIKNKINDKNNKIYMSIEDIREFLDNSLYHEEETGTYITTSLKKVATLKENSNDITINGSKIKIQDNLIDIEGIKYIAISEMSNVYDYEFNYSKDTNIVTIDSLRNKKQEAELKKNAKLKETPKAFSNSIKTLSKGDKVVYIEDYKNKVKVRTKDGIIGYLKKSNLENIKTIREDFIENTDKKNDEINLEYSIIGKDISTFEKRQNIINLILQQAIKNDKMYVKLVYDEKDVDKIERFKIEAIPILKECGVAILF